MIIHLFAYWYKLVKIDIKLDSIHCFINRVRNWSISLNSKIRPPQNEDHLAAVPHVVLIVRFHCIL